MKTLNFTFLYEREKGFSSSWGKEVLKSLEKGLQTTHVGRINKKEITFFYRNR